MRTNRRILRQVVAVGLSISLILGQTTRAADDVTPSAQSHSPVTASSQAAPAATTTVLVPQNQVTYETVYDVQYVQVPVTVNQTQYKTEYRTQTVPVTRTVVENVPVTVDQTQYKTEYRTRRCR